ncbi:MAG: hypothetical protein HKN31_03855, partial [Pricia sp.]|nr:hypothetical protein [Pricia sp.]
MLKERKFTILFLGWMVFITYASLHSFEDTDTSKFDIPYADKIVHFIFYSVAAVLATLFVREISKGTFPLVKMLWFIAFGAIVFGIIIEVLQYTITADREADFFDAVAN